MTIPSATYRLQFRNGMTFDRAIALVPYLQRLGISHLYASPVFTATQGSTHGYDITDANEIDPSLGGRVGFDRLVKALQQAGLELIIDIVPNHMAASLENAWWRDVIEHGEQSRYARHFDIDWSRRLTLPFLGDTFEAVLNSGDIAVKADPQSGKPALACYDSFYPLSPDSWQGQEAGVLALTDKTSITALHDRQPWRLMSWRDAAQELSYRRFFEITGLAGVRVEDPAVFADSHRLILELVHSGAVSGLRVDHVDGLADPKGYLQQLRQQAGPACYITVEKILTADEQLPADWPVSGTTGYEFIAALSEALIDGRQINALRQIYDQITGAPVDMAAELQTARELMVDKNFAGEFSVLCQLATSIARHIDAACSADDLRTALRALLVAFPVYRSYGTPDGVPPESVALLQRVAEGVRRDCASLDSAAIDLLLTILTGKVAAAVRPDAAQFRTRFQQLTGPLMAKSVEDTLFFRQHMALALNEVGAEALPHNFSLAHFHEAMLLRLAHQPDGITGTSTHDTKRGEDARARLYSLSEAPQRWEENVARWRQINRENVIQLGDGPAPEPAVEWMLYQALAGVWPTAASVDEAQLAELEPRFIGFVEKALREAKLRTGWGDPNQAYEQAVTDYARRLLAPQNRDFLHDFQQALQPFIAAGLINSLSQTAIKLTAPGVPDIYQGSEAINLSLVDPDNRLEPDYNALDALLTQPADFASPQAWQNGQLKQRLIATLLPLRQQHAALFRHGDYLPLQANGPAASHAIAFARIEAGQALIVVTPRLCFNRPDYCEQTSVALDPSLAGRRYRNLLSDEIVCLEERLSLDHLNQGVPLILLSC